MTSSDGETNQGGTLFKGDTIQGGHYFSIPSFHMGKLIKGGNHGLRTPIKVQHLIVKCPEFLNKQTTSKLTV